MIEFRQVSASYDGELAILRDVSFTVGDGDFVAFVGTNGAGKSTTMRLINGLLKPTSGEVLIDRVPTSRLKTSELASKVGFLFQNPDRQICCKTVREELLFGFVAQGRAGAEAEAKVDAMIERFGFDGDAEPFLLNRGTRQLLALASIIVLEPPIVVLDEPTTGLDFRECAKVMEVVSDLNARGTTVVMVCHDMEVVGDYATRVIAMTAGQVVADGATFDVLRDAGVLSRAHLLPPQIVELSMRLAQEGAVSPASPVACANTLDGMERACKRSWRARERGHQMKGFLEYVPGESFLHTMNPAAKLAAAFLLVIACFTTSNFILLAVVIVLDAVMAVQCKMVQQTIGLAKAVAAFSVVLALIALLFTPQGDVLVSLPWGYIGTASVLNAVLIVVRLVACAVPLFLVFYVTKLTDMANALVKVLHVPYKYAFTFMSTVHFIPVFMNDMAGIMEAQTARGVEFDGGLVKKVRLMVPLCVPLLVSSVRKTNSAAIAAEVRGFNLRTRESGFKEYPFSGIDFAAMGIAAALLVVAILLSVLL